MAPLGMVNWPHMVLHAVLVRQLKSDQLILIFLLRNMFFCKKICPKTEAFKEWNVYLLIQNMRVWKKPSFQSVFEPQWGQSQWNTGSSPNLQRQGSANKLSSGIYSLISMSFSSFISVSFFKDLLTYIGEFFVTLQGLNDAGMIIPKT